MSQERGDDIKAFVQRQYPYDGPRPDLADVELRVRNRRRSERIRAGSVGLAVGLVALAVLVVGLWNRSANPQQPAAVNSPLTPGSLGYLRQALPEGTWLLDVGGHGEVVSKDDSESEFVPNLLVHDLSPDGSTIAATVEESTSSGLSLQRNLVVVDRKTGSEKTLVVTSGNESLNQPVMWSPDGTMIAYVLVTWSSDPALSVPSGDPSQALCVLTLATVKEECFDNVSPIFSIGWAPTSAALVVGGPGTQPISTVDLSAGTVTTVMPPGGSPSVRQAFARQGLGKPTGFFSLSWSPSGDFLAAYANLSQAGPTPVIFDTSGDFAAMGEENPEAPLLQWSPVSDSLAYTTGLYNDTMPGVNWGVHLLNPSTGSDSLLVSTQDSPTPEIFAIAWSPSGRWLALDGSDDIETDVLRVVDTSGKDPIEEVSLDAKGEPTPLKDWAP